jgi:RNA ligase
MKYDLNILNDYIGRGLLIKNPHPTLPLDIYNYSRDCQFSESWDEITLNMRGTVLDREGNIVARTFPKFFNMEEHKPEEIPNEEFEVFEKMDGSLGILFHYEGEWHLATRGSFASDQAIKGKEILSRYRYDKLIPGYTYLFEIIYPENRIVCDYEYEDLVMLAVIDNKDGYELRIHDNDIHLEGIRFVNLYNNLGFKIVKKYDGVQDYKQLKSMIENNAEGFVIKFKSGFRMKIKGEEYVRLHRLLTNFSNVDIWELLKDGKNLDEFLDRVPDEFDKWVKGTIKNLQYHKYAIEERAGKTHDYFRYGKYNDRETEPTKKEFAEHLEFCKVEPSIRSICFAMWDGKNYDHITWKMLKPKYQKPFWNKEEEIPADSKWIKKD